MIHCLIYADQLEDQGFDTTHYRRYIERFLHLKPRVRSPEGSTPSYGYERGVRGSPDRGDGWGGGETTTVITFAVGFTGGEGNFDGWDWDAIPDGNGYGDSEMTGAYQQSRTTNWAGE